MTGIERKCPHLPKVRYTRQDLNLVLFRAPVLRCCWTQNGHQVWVEGQTCQWRNDPDFYKEFNSLHFAKDLSRNRKRENASHLEAPWRVAVLVFSYSFTSRHSRWNKVDESVLSVCQSEVGLQEQTLEGKSVAQSDDARLSLDYTGSATQGRFRSLLSRWFP